MYIFITQKCKRLKPNLYLRRLLQSSCAASRHNISGGLTIQRLLYISSGTKITQTCAVRREVVTELSLCEYAAAAFTARTVARGVTKETSLAHCARDNRSGCSTVQRGIQSMKGLYRRCRAAEHTHPREAWSYWRNVCWCRPTCQSGRWQTPPWSLSGHVAFLCPEGTRSRALSRVTG